MTNSTVSNNTGTGHGGGILFGGSSLTILNSLVENNTAGDEGGGGGGIMLSSGTATITGSTISGNTALSPAIYDGGGGIWSNGALILSDSTITGNTANSIGGGIRLSTDGRGFLQQTNTTISGNSAPVDPDCAGC